MWCFLLYVYLILFVVNIDVMVVVMVDKGVGNSPSIGIGGCISLLL